MTEFDDPITLRIFRASNDQWSGRLLIGEEEIVLGVFKSTQAVEQCAKEIGLHPERVEVEAC